MSFKIKLKKKKRQIKEKENLNSRTNAVPKKWIILFYNYIHTLINGRTFICLKISPIYGEASKKRNP